MQNVIGRLCRLAPVALVLAAAPAAAVEEGRSVGGHVGIATPLVTVTEDDTTNIGDQFDLVVPIGITVKLSERYAIDFETQVVSPIDPAEGPTGFVVAPGAIYNFGPFAAGLRLAFQVGNASSNVGLIPLINRGLFPVGQGTWFLEAAFPTFLFKTGPTDVAFNAVIHTGIAF